MYGLLDEYKDKNEIKKMNINELNEFANNIRNFLIDKVSKTGGHLASNLGVVELTLALFKVFDLEKDKIVWDVGHQTYVHKILTGRKEQFNSLRKFGGLCGFPKRSESKYDFFEVGHSSTSFSAALGMARARDIKGEESKVVAVIGDGALTGGMALEALNDIGDKHIDIILILNDNQMSISKNVGGISKYLNNLRVDPNYNKLKGDFNQVLNKTFLGKGIAGSLKKLKGGIRHIVVPNRFFENIGIKYFGPIDGHNITQLSQVMELAKDIKGPVLIHTITTKGKGYDFAEKNPHLYHGIGPFDKESGKASSKKQITYSKAFGDAIVELAKNDNRVTAITAAMPGGTGLQEFSEEYKNRFFDVGIAEQHAVTLAAGMASSGLKPIFAVYSTFLQRAYDQIIHDVCMQELPVIFCIDRAGIVGEDGETHQGVFDLSFLSHIPNLVIVSPKCVGELKYLLKWALTQNKPIAIRYPRGGDEFDNLIPKTDFQIGKWETIKKGKNVAIIATGRMVSKASNVAVKLNKIGIEASVINASFIKPIDKTLLTNLVKSKIPIVTIEDNYVNGGFGSLILQYLNQEYKDYKILNLGFKDEFITHGNIDVLFKLYNLDENGIFSSIVKFI
ncbi:1-deoxy-D-xylulose-5-phosphate synthase [Clostridium sp. DL1XJH146]